MYEITKLQRPQIDQAVRVLTAAFDDDVMWEAILPDAEERNRVMPVLWRGVVAYCQRYGIVSVTPDVKGVAAWAKPGHAHPTLWKQIRAGFLLPRSVLLMSKISRERFLRVMKQIDGLHRQLMPQSHWYLWALGVDPASQSQGIGRSLLVSVLAQAAEDRFPCYLETQTESNVAFYLKQGFELLHEAEFLEVGLQLWFMRKSVV